MAPKRQQTVNAIPIDEAGAALGTSGNPLYTASTAGGESVTIAGPLGRKADALSVSEAWSTEDVALITALNTVLGLTSDAAVTTDASGTINAHLRGALVELIALLATAGGTTDAAVSTDANGTMNAHLRGQIVNLVALLASLGATTDAAVTTDANGSVNAHLRGVLVEAIAILASLGATADAAVTAGATGSVNAHLRSISRDLVANIVLAAGSAIIGKVGIDQTTPGTTNLVAAGQNGTWTVQPGNTQNTTPWLVSPLATAIDVTLTRPNDTTTYAANDEISSSTSAPSVNTITGAARASGGYVRLRAASCVDSSNVATKAQILVYVFDTTTTPNNDNAAFAPSDGALNTCVAVLPFNIWYPGDDTSGAGGNAFSPYLGPEIDIKTVGSANLFFRVKVLNAYVPTAQEAFVFRFDFVQY